MTCDCWGRVRHALRGPAAGAIRMGALVLIVRVRPGMESNDRKRKCLYIYRDFLDFELEDAGLLPIYYN